MPTIELSKAVPTPPAPVIKYPEDFQNLVKYQLSLIISKLDAIKS